VINFFIGLVVLLISATVFLEIMQTISAKWKLSPLLVSLVIVGLGTNLPELVVTISSLTHHDPGLAFGNLVGSSIINLSLIFGLAVVAGHVKIGNHKTQKNALVLLGVTLLFIALRFSPIPNAIQAVLLLLALGGSLGYEYWLGVSMKTKISLQKWLK